MSWQCLWKCFAISFVYYFYLQIRYIMVSQILLTLLETPELTTRAQEIWKYFREALLSWCILRKVATDLNCDNESVISTIASLKIPVKKRVFLKKRGLAWQFIFFKRDNRNSGIFWREYSLLNSCIVVRRRTLSFIVGDSNEAVELLELIIVIKKFIKKN